MSGMNSQDYYIQKLLKHFTGTRRLHFCVHYLTGIFQEDARFQVDPVNRVHSCTFCNAAKTTSKGLRLCLKNKALSIERALSHKELYIGQCFLGVTEIVKPIFINDRPCCIVYLGNFITNKDYGQTRPRIKRIVALSGVAPQLLEDALDTLEIIEEGSVQELAELVDVFAISMELSITNYLEQSKKSKILRTSDNKPGHWAIEQVINYIESFYYTDIRLPQIAKLYYINPQYLCRLFVKETGVNFTDYLNRLRVEKAKEFLTATDKSITEIALSTGFNNVTYFNNVFKGQTFMTPSRYRRENPSRVPESSSSFPEKAL